MLTSVWFNDLPGNFSGEMLYGDQVDGTLVAFNFEVYLVTQINPIYLGWQYSVGSFAV